MFRLTLRFRNIEEMLALRWVDLNYETVGMRLEVGLDSCRRLRHRFLIDRAFLDAARDLL